MGWTPCTDTETYLLLAFQFDKQIFRSLTRLERVGKDSSSFKPESTEAEEIFRIVNTQLTAAVSTF